jgi:hypothetical protein
MHNTDRTQLEFETDSESYEFESEPSPCKCGAHRSKTINEVDEMELAAELLEVNDEYELDQFLGKFIKRIGRGVKKFVRSPVGGALFKALKGAALSAVPGLAPVVGAATALSSAVKNVASEPPPEPTVEDAGEIFGLELEGLSPQDQEFEVARRFVRFGAEAVAQAANAGDAMSAEQAASEAVAQAAARHAPGLQQRGRPSYSRGSGYGAGYGPGGQRPRLGRSGRWVRRGRQITLLDM